MHMHMHANNHTNIHPRLGRTWSISLGVRRTKWKRPFCQSGPATHAFEEGGLISICRKSALDASFKSQGRKFGKTLACADAAASAEHRQPRGTRG